MKLLKIILPFLFAISLIWVSSCNETATKPQTGIIRVTVFDISTDQPVQDVEIKIMPNDLIQKTDKDGASIFEVEPSEYFVDASVCCVGPGFIQYHEPVTVTANQTITIELEACLVCL